MTTLRPADHVRAAAFGSAAAIAVFVLIQQSADTIVRAVPGIFVPLAIVWDIALWLWAAGLAVTVFATSSSRAARIAASASVVAPALLGYGQLVGSFTTLVPIAYLVIFVAAGVAMLIENIEAGRAGELSRLHAGLGAVVGVAYAVGGMGGVGFLGTPLLVALAAVGLQVLMGAHALYVGWALWLGARAGHEVPVAARALA